MAYGPPFGIGLPVDPPEGRPLVIVHPAAAAHHHASFGLVSDAGHPFIHVVVDYGEYTPDGWGINANEAGMATWQRISDTSQGHAVYRKASLSTPHWQVHIQHEAYSNLTTSPPVDVLYVDWLEWLDPHSTGDDSTFSHLISAYVHKIREGGLVVLDLKHSHFLEGEHPWFASSGQAVLHLDNGSMLVNKGPVEWMSPDFYGNMQTHSASVFQVHHGVEGPLAEKNWDDAMQPWFWTTVPEVSMSPAQLKALMAQKAKPIPRRPHPGTVDEELDEVSRRARIGPAVPRPHAARTALACRRLRRLFAVAARPSVALARRVPEENLQAAR